MYGVSEEADVMNPADDPVVQAQQLNAELRQAFAADVDGLLTELRAYCAALEPTVGSVSREDLWRSVQAFVLAKFAQRLAVRSDDVRDLLYAAVAHVLDQIQVNPDVHYYCGWGTQIFYLLVRAEAAYLGKPLDLVEAERRLDRQPSYRRREPEVCRLRDQRDELIAQLDGSKPCD